MAQVELLGGAYTARSLIANAQRCVNLFPEVNPGDAPAKVTHYQRAGLRYITDAPIAPFYYGSRAMLRASNGELFEIVDDKVYYTTPLFVRTLLGSITTGFAPVFMCDNGIVLVIVDSYGNGWTVGLIGHVFAQIVDPAFYGSTRVTYLDTYLVFNRPNSTQMYLSPPNWNGTDPFDPLDIADKVGNPDPLVGVIANAGQLWLIGTLTTEVWYNSGGADFPFARAPGVLIQHGTNAPMAVCRADIAVFWITQDVNGTAMAVMGNGYEAVRITTHAIEVAWASYSTLADGIAFTYQQEGHTFWQVNFPTADATWVYDMATKLWAEQTSIDDNGIEHVSAVNCAAYAYGKSLAGTWHDGFLVEMDPNFYLDIDQPIVYRRGFPHLVKDGKRLVYSKFMADMQAGSAGGLLLDNPAMVYLRWSDSRGQSFGDPVAMSLGATGQYEDWPTAWQLGSAIDRVFEIFWSAPYATALNGAYIVIEKTDA